MADAQINPTTEPPDVILRLDITIAHAQAVAAALDFFTRLSLGQLDEIAGKFSHGEFRVACGDSHTGRSPTVEECCDIRRLCADIKLVAGHKTGSSFGLGSRAVGEKAHASYEVLKVLQQALALHRDPTPSLQSVDYDGLTVRYTTQPAPRCTIKSQEGNKNA